MWQIYNLQIPILSAELRAVIERILNLEPEPNIPIPKLPSSGRCSFFPRKKDRKSRISCKKCNKFICVCLEHQTKVCPECSKWLKIGNIHLRWVLVCHEICFYYIINIKSLFLMTFYWGTPVPRENKIKYFLMGSVPELIMSINNLLSINNFKFYLQVCLVYKFIQSTWKTKIFMSNLYLS